MCHAEAGNQSNHLELLEGGVMEVVGRKLAFKSFSVLYYYA